MNCYGGGNFTNVQDTENATEDKAAKKKATYRLFRKKPDNEEKKKEEPQAGAKGPAPIRDPKWWKEPEIPEEIDKLRHTGELKGAALAVHLLNVAKQMDKMDTALENFFRCPISMEMINDPVYAADGHTHKIERESMEWERRKNARAGAGSPCDLEIRTGG